MLFRKQPVIDTNNNTGLLEFSIPGYSDDFFPIVVSFHSTKMSFTDMEGSFAYVPSELRGRADSLEPLRSVLVVPRIEVPTHSTSDLIKLS